MSKKIIRGFRTNMALYSLCLLAFVIVTIPVEPLLAAGEALAAVVVLLLGNRRNKMAQASVRQYMDRVSGGMDSARSSNMLYAPLPMLVFDVNTAAKLAALDGQVFLDETEDTYCVWRAAYSRGLCTYYMDLFQRRGDGAWERREELHRERAYSVEELTAWLTEAGFGDIRVYGDTRLRRPREDEQRVYVCCVRK